VDVIVNNGVNSFDFESVASSPSPSNHVSPAGNNANSGMAVPASWPTSPWCKWIDKDGAEAGSIASQRNNRSGGIQSLNRLDSCSGLP